MKRYFVIVFATLLFSASTVCSQAVPAAGRGWDEKPATWNISAAGSYLETSSSGSQINLYGWNGSISQYPYSSLSWLGASVEMSGHYDSESRSELSNGSTYRLSVNRAVYTYAGGPSVMSPRGRVRPFGHALFGAISSQTKDRVNGITIRPFDLRSESWLTHAGMLLGGGFDLGIDSALAIRAQADWVQEWAPSQMVNFVHASAGVVYRF